MNRIDLRQCPKAKREVLGDWQRRHLLGTQLVGQGLASGLWRLLNCPSPGDYVLPEIDAIDNCQHRL